MIQLPLRVDNILLEEIHIQQGKSKPPIQAINFEDFYATSQSWTIYLILYLFLYSHNIQHQIRNGKKENGNKAS